MKFGRIKVGDSAVSIENGYTKGSNLRYIGRVSDGIFKGGYRFICEDGPYKGQEGWFKRNEFTIPNNS
jgi:hypothetical protein